MPSDPYLRLSELATVVPTATWMLVGGLMVHCHAERVGIVHPRPTDDADLVLEVTVSDYASAARGLESLGYRRHLSLDARAPFHRFTREDGEHVDLMVDEEVQVRHAGRSVLGVPGARSALRRTIAHELPGGTVVRLPDLGSALSLKGAAYRQPGSVRERHLQDGVTLFACATEDLRLSRSMRTNVNALIGALDAASAWSLASPAVRLRAVRTIRTVRPDWQPPSYVLPQRRRP